MDDKAAARFWAKVDRRGPDDCWLWTASTNPKGYGWFRLGNKILLAHRVLWESVNGTIPAKLWLDHRHTCPKNCVNPGHLRLATNKQNHENLPGANRNSKSGVRGVSLHRASGLWRGTVVHNGKQHSVGYFKTIPEAENAVRLRRIELHSHNDVDRVTTRL